MPSVKSLLARIESELEQLEKLAYSGKPLAPTKRLELTAVEWDLWERRATPEEYKSSSLLQDPGLMLNRLKESFGYERIQTNTKVTVRFRRNGSDPVVAAVDGCRGSVIGTDEFGSPWVQFAPADWQRAIEKTRKGNASPLQTDAYGHVEPKKRAIRLNPLDTKEYRHMLGKAGLGTLSILQVTGQKHAYLYDPLVTDLLGVSKQQLLYVLRNMNDIAPEYAEDKEKEENIEPLPPNPEASVKTALLLKIAVAPSAKAPPSALTDPKSGMKRLKIWQEMFKDKDKVKSIKKAPPFIQWPIAISIYINTCLSKGVMPFKKWTNKNVKEWRAKQKAKLAKKKTKAA